MAEETERCGRKLGQLHIETSALIAMGSMASSLSGKAPAESYFERALEVLGAQPARFQRGWIEWEMGNTLARLGQTERAARSFEAALSRSREIGDATGEAIVTLDLAALRRPRASRSVCSIWCVACCRRCARSRRRRGWRSARAR
ncbi:hypothetical protein FSC37_01515 [Piscinibacter aquaticus]|uniref:Tetratricopeptide repeat protein n=1 Tax=Piscinibacter aquaticus TaxID=392597 RepID=A0A5C6TXV2_9BURK|nr:hypothetical protein FSC37_01515 [Piscinibacter aquaticus]